MMDDIVKTVTYADGTQVWFTLRNNRAVFHRLDGPAVIWDDGTEEWWINDVVYSFKEYIKFIQDEDQKLLLILKYNQDVQDD